MKDVLHTNTDAGVEANLVKIKHIGVEWRRHTAG
jgi:hypothetical protein